MRKEDLKNTEGLIVPIRYDEVFKEVFGNEDYPNITAFLMSKLLNIPYEVIKDHVLFIQKGQKNRKVLEKNSEKDIVFLIDFDEPMKINLEANINPSKQQSIIDRNLYYFSNLFGNSLSKKDDYTKIKTTIQYNFNTFYTDKVHTELIDEYSFKNKYGYNLSEKIKIVHINIEEMKNIWYNKKYKNYDDELRQIICIGALMMINVKEDFIECLKEIKTNSDIIIDIERIVERMNEDEEIFVRYYNREEEDDRIRRSIIAEEVAKATKKAKEEARKEGLEEGLQEGLKEGLQQGIEQGIEQGIAQGILEERKNNIISLLEKGLEVEKVSKYLNIPIEEIIKLKNN